MKSFYLWLFLCFGAFAVSSVGAEMTTDQFAYGLPVQVSGDHAFYELELPLAVYQESVRNDLGDIRVFNAAGQVVPHALRSPSNQTRQQDVASADLPFFPLMGNADLPGDDLSVHVERTPEGSVIDVRVAGRQGGLEDGRPSGYLLDASGLERRIDALELRWSDDTPDFLAEVVVETSRDLISWQPLTTAAVARLSHQNSRFDQNRIVVSRVPQRYLRLHWPSGQSPVNLLRVRVYTEESHVVDHPAKNRLTLTAEAFGENSYRVDLKGALPVSEVSIVLPDKNSLAAMRLLSSSSEKNPLQERWHGLAYHLANNGVEITTPAISLPPLRQRFWELVLKESETIPGASPRLTFGWQPDRLVFLSRGEGPFLVAYGNAAAEPVNYPLETLLKSFAAAAGPSLEPQLVQPGEPLLLAGKEAQSTSPELPWKEYSLWGVLFLGVLLIGGMSLSLYRKLRDTETDERP